MRPFPEESAADVPEPSSKDHAPTRPDPCVDPRVKVAVYVVLEAGVVMLCVAHHPMMLSCRELLNEPNAHNFAFDAQRVRIAQLLQER